MLANFRTGFPLAASFSFTTTSYLLETVLSIFHFQIIFVYEAKIIEKSYLNVSLRKNKYFHFYMHLRFSLTWRSLSSFNNPSTCDIPR